MRAQGAAAFRSIVNSPSLHWVSKTVRAEDAMRLFLPPVIETAMGISTPLPKARQEWIKGFKKEQNDYLARDQS